MNASTDEAARFLAELYRGQPEPSLIAVGKATTPHFVRTPADALPYVVGECDVYHRVTLLGKHPGKGRRGSAKHSIWLPGCFADIDVNGTPNGKGGVKTGAAPDRDTALALAHAVLEPTLLVDSGGGIHGYWLLDEPLILGDAEAREAASALTTGWIRRLVQEAGFGLDSVGDLARPMRPVGSLNGKGEHPVPVRLLHEGSRYALAQLRELTVSATTNGRTAYRVAFAAAVSPPAADNDATAEKIISEHSTLAKIVKRKVNKPKGGSDSDWDFYLGCQAARLAFDDAALARLIIHNRQVNGDPQNKAGRDDYLERTITAVRQQVPWTDPADPDDSRAENLAAISRAWALGDDPVVSGTIHGLDAGSGAGVVVLTRASGEIVRFAKYAHLFDSRAYARTVRHYNGGANMATPKQPEIERIASMVLAVCEITEHDPAAEARDWLHAFDLELGGASSYDPCGTSAERWAQLAAAREQADKLAKEFPRAVPARQTVALVDPKGNTWIPAGALLASIPRAVDATELRSRMHEAGVERREVEVRRPGVAHRDRKAEDRIRGVYYLLNEPDDDAEPEDDDA